MNLFYLFSQFDNQLRKDKSMTGMIEKMRQGYWVFAPPRFYKNLNPKATADKAKLVVSEKGKLIRKAFKMKAKLGMSNRQVKERLEEMGLNITEKALGRVFKNPFYCGMITSALIPGEVIEGHHEKMVSKELFLQVNDLLNRNHHGYQVTPQYESLWLQNFIVCHVCGTPYTGYKKVKPSGREYFYYKCNTRSCRKNRKDTKVNESFLDFLRQFQIDPRLKEPLLEAMKGYFSELHKDHLEEFSLIEGNIKGIDKKLENVEEKYITGEIEKDLYQKFKDKFQKEKKRLLAKTGKSKISLSNLRNCLEKVVEICANLLEFWRLLKVDQKKRFLEVMFPERIVYDFENDSYRTPEVNPFIAITSSFTGNYEQKEKSETLKLEDFGRWVVPAGIEPTSSV